MGRTGNAIMLGCTILGAVFAGGLLYLGAASAFDFWPYGQKVPAPNGVPLMVVSPPISPLVLWIFGALAVALLSARWAPLLIGRFSPPAPSTFLPGWPDAIRAKWIEDHSTSTIPSTFIFHLKCEAAVRREFGHVIVYCMVGGTRRPASYHPHELWFSIDGKRLLRPDEVADDRLDGVGDLYKWYFLRGVDCGGETIDEIKNAGNAFALAQKWK